MRGIVDDIVDGFLRAFGFTPRPGQDLDQYPEHVIVVMVSAATVTLRQDQDSSIQSSRDIR